MKKKMHILLCSVSFHPSFGNLMIPFVFPVVDNGRCWLKSCQMMAAPEGTKLNPPKEIRPAKSHVF